MDLCVMIEGQEGVSWADWQAIAAACEEHGISTLFRSDHYLPLGGHEERQVLDAWGTIIALAATTTTLRLGALVSPATFRHPSEFAKLVVTADHVSGGRIDVGLGAGWNEREHAAYGFPYGTFGDRFDRYAEQLEIVHGLWADGPFSFSGEYYELDRVDAQPKPVQRPLPFIVGGMAKPRTLALADRFADEYNTVFCTPQEASERRARVPDHLRFSVMTGLVSGRDEAELERRKRRLADEHGAGEMPAGWIVGTPDALVARLREYRDAGCDRVMLQLLLHDEVDQIALIGELARELS
jgi:alkanesulfonate monooxygenase SsuD/methylene tetrahydromethanopterin reductase-like flavin-dependent oxidoreductase (luciferase family)